jgi:hypothetical protein
MTQLLRAISFFLCFTCVYANQDVAIDGTINQQLPIKHPHTIELLNLKLSSQAKKTLNQRFNLESRFNQLNLQSASSRLPSQVQLGMNNVPVLDQGPHGTCATFATTAALDALLAKGDYISQLCTLSLNEYLTTHGHTETLWDGAFPKQIFNIVSMFGIVNNEKQHQFGCGGMTEYPNDPYANHGEIDVDSYHQLSENVQNLVEYDTTNIFDVFQFIYEETSMNKVLDDAKLALANGDRLTIGIILVPDENIGAYGRFHEANDTWVLNNEIKKYIQSGSPIAGHALVITGYDDKAISIDEDGNKHQGLFTLRNSWGDKAGDHGNYYISYDYFRSLLADLVRVRKMKD